MKKFIVISWALMASHISIAQTEFQATVSKVVKFVERNIHIENKGQKEFIDFVVYDISIDTNGRIEDIDLLILDSLQSSPSVNQIANNIKKQFSFGETNYRKLYIPVMMIYSNDEVDDSQKNSHIFATIQFFESLNKIKNENVFVSRLATIAVYENKRVN